MFIIFLLKASTQSDPNFHKNPAKMIKSGFWFITFFNKDPLMNDLRLKTSTFIPNGLNLLITRAFELLVYTVRTSTLLFFSKNLKIFSALEPLP